MQRPKHFVTHLNLHRMEFLCTWWSENNCDFKPNTIQFYYENIVINRKKTLFPNVKILKWSRIGLSVTYILSFRFSEFEKSRKRREKHKLSYKKHVFQFFLFLFFLNGFCRLTRRVILDLDELRTSDRACVLFFVFVLMLFFSCINNFYDLFSSVSLSSSLKRKLERPAVIQILFYCFTISS